MTKPAAAASTATAKFGLLNENLARLLEGGLVVAFSGGVDSTFLLWAAEEERKKTGGRLLGVTTSSDSLASSERADVEKFVAESGVAHVWRVSGEVDDPRYAVNDAARCFYCKSELFRICGEVVAENGFASIAYGYNASDRGDVRPGHQAALENNVVSPLDDAGLTKDEIRELMRENGLYIADKPASPCLSSRVMTGVQITPKRLKDIDAIETVIREKGIRVFRVRMHETGGKKLLRIEVAEDEMERAFEVRSEITDAANALGYAWVTLDLNGYATGGGNIK